MRGGGAGRGVSACFIPVPPKLTLVIFLIIVVTTAPEFYYTHSTFLGCLLKKQLDHSLVQKSLPIPPSLGLCSSEGSTPPKAVAQDDV